MTDGQKRIIDELREAGLAASAIIRKFEAAAMDSTGEPRPDANVPLIGDVRRRIRESEVRSSEVQCSLLQHDDVSDISLKYHGQAGLSCIVRNTRLIELILQHGFDDASNIRLGFVDGLYGVASQGVQVITLAVLTRWSEVVPVMYSISTTRTTEQYRVLFAAARRHGVPLTHVMADFETAIKNAALAEYLDIDVRGCAFHFMQACRRRWTKIYGSARKYKGTWNCVVKDLRSLYSAKSYPEFQATFESMQEFLRTKKLTEFLQYFIDVWIEGKYPPQQWSSFEAEDAILTWYRTNNAVEANNRIIKEIVFASSRGGNVFTCVDKLSKDLKVRLHRTTMEHKSKPNARIPGISHADLQRLLEGQGVSQGSAGASQGSAAASTAKTQETYELTPLVEQQLRRMGLERVRVDDGGTCFFIAAAVNLGMGNNLQAGAHVRRMMVRELQENAALRAWAVDFLAQDDEEPLTLNEYIERLKHGEQADGLAIMALATYQRREIVIIFNRERQLNVQQETFTPLLQPGEELAEDEPLRVIFHPAPGDHQNGQGHYEAAVQPRGTTNIVSALTKQAARTNTREARQTTRKRNKAADKNKKRRLQNAQVLENAAAEIDQEEQE